MSEVNQGFIGRILDYSPTQKPITSQRPPIFYTSKQFYVCYSVQRKTHDLFDPFDPICDNVLKYSQFHKIALRRKGSKGQKGHSFFYVCESKSRDIYIVYIRCGGIRHSPDNGSTMEQPGVGNGLNANRLIQLCSGIGNPTNNTASCASCDRQRIQCIRKVLVRYANGV